MKFLIIRFSSIGDVTQSLSLPSKIAEYYSAKNSQNSDQPISPEIHFAVREDIAEIVEGHPHIQKIWKLPRRSGLKGLWAMLHEMKRENFTHIYDAHNSLRSRIICLFLSSPFHLGRIFNPPKIIRKSRKRWKRFLLFVLRKDTYRKPLSGQRDLLEPLAEWQMTEDLPPPPQMFVSDTHILALQKQLPVTWIDNFVCMAPSAAYELKRWPREYFIEVAKKLPHLKFVLLGGPQDLFIEEIHKECPENTLNLSGKLSLSESAAAVFKSKGIIANDTGLLHFAEQLGIRAVALMGPAPFGFPSRPLTHILERKIPCRPCSKHGQGPCINSDYHFCLRDIKPIEVIQIVQGWRI